jgi:hypothetical protein
MRAALVGNIEQPEPGGIPSNEPSAGDPNSERDGHGRNDGLDHEPKLLVCISQATSLDSLIGVSEFGVILNAGTQAQLRVISASKTSASPLSVGVN